MSNTGERDPIDFMPDGWRLQLVPEIDKTLQTPTEDEVGVFDFYERVEWLKASAGFREKPTLLSQESFVGGYLKRYGFVTNLGYTYDATVGIPLNPATNIPTLQTSAWVTSSHGHNEHTLRRFVESGSPFIFVGPEGSYRPNSKYPIPKDGISLASSAAAVLNFSKEISFGHQYDFDPALRSVIGESRGAMTAMGILALDSVFNQEVIFADLTAPCFPRKAEIRDILKLSGHLISEPRSILKLAGKLGLSRLIHYPSTIDPHPYSLAHQIAMGPALFSGEAGDLARLISNDKVLHITCFDDDFASMPKVWKDIFENHNDVRITLLEGSHLTIADPETLKYLVARNMALRQQLASNSNQNIDGQAIFDYAHHIVDTIS